MAFTLAAQAAQGQYQEWVTVVGSRLNPSPLRRVLVWQQGEISRLPLRHWSDLLRFAAGVGLARRGLFGVQGDTALLGSTFEGVLVLVNGIPVNDPQTGHFHLNVPIPLEAIERVEVLTGAASSVLGSNAFGGVIAITTRPGTSALLGASAGSFSFSGLTLAVPLLSKLGFFGEMQESQGFRPDSDFHQGRALLTWGGSLGRWQVATSLGAGRSQFGAWTFYSSRFPHQRERTNVALLTFRAERALSPSLTVAVAAGARQHRDVYLLDKTRPWWYRNRHRTRQATMSVLLRGERPQWQWVLGADGERQLLQSSRLGLHDRNRAGLFAEVSGFRGPWRVNLQARQDLFAGQARFTPGAGVSFTFSSGAQLSLSLGTAFRLPSFTELYYRSPASLGTPRLGPERAQAGEVTLSLPWRGHRWHLSAFRRHAHGLIDWVRGEDGVFRAQNYARSVSWGVTGDWVQDQGPVPWRLYAAYLESQVAADPRRSAYALTHPRWEGSFSATVPWGRLLFTPVLLYRKPQGRGGFALVDAAWQWPLSRQLALRVEVHNLLDRAYEEVPGVPQPGPWWTLGLTWRP
ncbi:MAG: TonB-dependent receptor [Thermoanaerobaculum sp.]|nr:TonB-dependent receptor [Thermoanaerobaculum sp.]